MTTTITPGALSRARLDRAFAAADWHRVGTPSVVDVYERVIQRDHYRDRWLVQIRGDLGSMGTVPVGVVRAR
ncbi:hypothetical protein KNT75_gp86 [Gordonia phage Kabluna]|uniref:Uncharacterized protein n=1 Tax=Gordonia phage Kabluna TaxID=2041511 RepID=A0A2D1GCR9_9CAUD|nr:hypothetical protein KNT75_gp86 [Gordonia phage Kabluna]ATN89616.1 hypothetical protein SEA_KABLUNA_86 [Gordonia phage Kabluna]